MTFKTQSRHRGLEDKQATAYSEGEGSNPVANFLLRSERPFMTRETNEFGNETKTGKRRARERPLTRERARNRGLDLKL